MTIAGAACSLDRALLWADSSVGCADVIVGHTCKLAINALAGLVGTGTGPASLIRDADGLLCGAATLRQVIEELPPRLRSSAARQKTIPAAYAVAAFDPAFGRVVIYEFQSPFFAPELTTFFLAPRLDVPRPEGVLEALDIAIAQHQAAAGYAGGILSIAELTARGVTACTALDLDTMELIEGVHARQIATREPSAECAGASG